MNTGHQQQGFWIADWWVQPAHTEIVKDGKSVQLEPKVMALLELLASRPGEVFSRQDLENTIWQGTIVGYDALSKAVTKLRDALGDDKKNPQYIQTISKKGYRLIAAVSNENPLHAVDSNKASVESDIAYSTTVVQKSFRKAVFASGLIVVIVAAIAIYAVFQFAAETDDEEQLTQQSVLEPVLQPVDVDKPVIVVLPFRNISPNQGDAYLAEGITSDLITDLSRLSGLLVMAIDAVFAYKDVDVSPEKMRQEFNARYVLSGEVNKVGQAIRINVHLTNVEQGTILWANRYDRQFSDFFAIQDEVTNKIVQSLELTLSKEERQRIARRYTSNLQAYDYFLRAQAVLNRRTPEDNAEAREWYNKAIEMDPGFARAYAGLAMTYVVAYNRQWPADVDNAMEKALQLSNRAIKLDNELPEGHWVAGFVNWSLKNMDAAIASLRHALSLDPNYADAYAMLGAVYNYTGQPETALDYLTRALRLNPTGGYLYKGQLGRAHYFMRNYEQALTYLEQAYQGNPSYIDTIYYMAATYVNLQRYDEAAWMILEAERTSPDHDLQTWIDVIPIIDERFKTRLLNDIKQAENYVSGINPEQ